MILTIVAAIFYAIASHIDKYLISKAVKNANYRSLILVSTIIAGGMMTPIYLFICNFSVDFDFPSIAILFVNSILCTIANILWYKALSRDDTTIITIMLQLIPVFVLLLSPLFLPDQNITLVQLIGGSIITLSAIFITYEPTKKKVAKSRSVTLGLMAIVSILYAIWFILIRYVNIDHDFNRTVFWSNLTLFVVGIIMFISLSSYRKSFNKTLKTNGPKVIGLNLVNELLNSFAGIFTTLAETMVPVALVSFASSGIEPFMVMAIGIMLTKFLPKTEKENITKKAIIKRAISIALCLIGLACIEFG